MEQKGGAVGPLRCSALVAVVKTADLRNRKDRTGLERVLKADSRAIFTAASKAQQATDWLIARAGISTRTVEAAACRGNVPPVGASGFGHRGLHVR